MLSKTVIKLYFNEKKFSERLLPELSDAIRYILMWRYGGAYSDTDIINLKKLPNNSMILALESSHVFNGNFLKTNKKYHKFYLQAINLFNERYNVSI